VHSTEDECRQSRQAQDRHRQPSPADEPESEGFRDGSTRQHERCFYPPSFTIGGRLSNGSHETGSYTGTLQAGTYVDACSAGPYGPFCAPATGSITFSLRGGAITTVVEPGGLVTELFTGPSTDAYIFDLSLSITGGTHAFAGAQGTLSFHYATERNNLATDPVTLAPCMFVDIATCPIVDDGTLTGTITR
jgi:hypothetical protein